MSSTSSTRGALRLMPLCIAIVACAVACGREGTDADGAASPGQREDLDVNESIGVATMEADGTIVLTLRAESGDGVVGDGRLVYPPSHEQYQYVLGHIGGLSPGEQKPVPPFPDDAVD